jgi:hypothetical protein
VRVYKFEVTKMREVQTCSSVSCGMWETDIDMDNLCK